MSITDELRRYISGPAKSGISHICEKAIANIADRIDAEHEHKVQQAHTDGLNEQMDFHDNFVPSNYILLPVDADGIPIRIGDMMEGVDKYDSLKKVMGKVITVSFESDGIVDVAIQAWSSDGKSWHRAYLDPDASVYRHYHEPTVEDVLREACNAYHSLLIEGMSDVAHDMPAPSEIIAEYSAKLRLANDGEEQ